jgi:hypothetical protein
MNTRSDTLEKHGNGIDQLKNKTASAPASAPTMTPQIPEYTPSIEDQYLPKSIRGNNNNPYTIMNAVTETVQKPDATTTATATTTTTTTDPIAATSIEVETVVESTQKEMVIEPIQTLSSSSSTVNHSL